MCVFQFFTNFDFIHYLKWYRLDGNGHLLPGFCVGGNLSDWLDRTMGSVCGLILQIESGNYLRLNFIGNSSYDIWFELLDYLLRVIVAMHYICSLLLHIFTSFGYFWIYRSVACKQDI